jgi:hypothetical protein
VAPPATHVVPLCKTALNIYVIIYKEYVSKALRLQKKP